MVGIEMFTFYKLPVKQCYFLQVEKVFSFEIITISYIRESLFLHIQSIPNPYLPYTITNCILFPKLETHLFWLMFCFICWLSSFYVM